MVNMWANTEDFLIFKFLTNNLLFKVKMYCVVYNIQM